MIFNPDTVWSRDYILEIKKMQNFYFSNNLKNILLITNKQKSFDKNLRGDFNLFNNLLRKDKVNKLVLAYEPIWAIGTGEVASIKDIVEVLDFVKNLVSDKPYFSEETIKFIYGGSVSPNNSSEILNTNIVDGAVGAAEIATGAVKATEVAAGGIAANTAFADGVVTQNVIAAGNVVTSKINNAAVTAAKIAAGNVVTAALNAGAVTDAKIATGTISSAKLSSGIINANTLLGSAVVTAHAIAGGNVGSSELRTSNLLTANTQFNAGIVTAHAIATGAVGPTELAAGAVSANTKMAADVVGARELRIGNVAAANGVFTHNAHTFVKAQRGTIDAVSVGAANVTMDFANTNHFALTLGTNSNLDRPSNLTAGQTGSIFVIQDGTGSRTLSYSSVFDFAGGTAPTLTTTASAVDRIDYVVRSSSSIHAVATLALS